MTGGMGGETALEADGPAGEGGTGAATPVAPADGARTGTGLAPGRAGGDAAMAGERPSAFIFDVFGTCVDWRTGVALALEEALGAKGVTADWDALADAWRNLYEPAMAPIRAGERGYVALDDLHRETLEAMLGDHGFADRFDDDELFALARAWERLPPWPDVHLGLRRLKALAPIAPCSNGSIALMTHLGRFADLPWDCVLGAEIAQDYKPKPEVYRAACAALRLDPSEVMMVACHPGDLDAAKAEGLRTGYIPRPTEWGETRMDDVMAVEDAARAYGAAAADLEALAALFGG
ncbi:haloacid dehalogenase type II [Rhodovulum sp. DZ06]|uniref:haloacid dehalogenase type II n=1 Tax=Rhodovulum sp. DZ06 TaxID=3425126 RepID=UPI003D35921D